MRRPGMGGIPCYSILADVASEGSELPWLAGYDAEALINWSDDSIYSRWINHELSGTALIGHAAAIPHSLSWMGTPVAPSRTTRKMRERQNLWRVATSQ